MLWFWEVFWWTILGQWKHWVHQTKGWTQHSVLRNFQWNASCILFDRRFESWIWYARGLFVWSDWKVHHCLRSLILNITWNRVARFSLQSLWSSQCNISKWDAISFSLWWFGTWSRLWSWIFNVKHRGYSWSCWTQYGRHRKWRGTLEIIWSGGCCTLRCTKLPGAISLALPVMEPLAASRSKSNRLHCAFWCVTGSVQGGAALTYHKKLPFFSFELTYPKAAKRKIMGNDKCLAKRIC